MKGTKLARLCDRRGFEPCFQIRAGHYLQLSVNTLAGVFWQVFQQVIIFIAVRLVRHWLQVEADVAHNTVIGVVLRR